MGISVQKITTIKIILHRRYMICVPIYMHKNHTTPHHTTQHTSHNTQHTTDHIRENAERVR